MNLNLNFTNCELRSSLIKTVTTRLQVSNCQMGSSFEIVDGEATFVNCTIYSTTILTQLAFIGAKNSTVILKSSQVVNWQAEGFLQISDGIGRITGVKFVNCTAISLISAIQHTSLLAENCTFLSNMGTTVELYNSSVGTVDNSLFADNRILHSNFSFFIVMCISGSYLQLMNSHFINNTILSDAGVLFVYESISFVKNCSFKNNIITEFTGVVLVMGNGILRMNTTTFSNNIGGAISLYDSSNFVISNCLFQCNIVDNRGGGIRCEGQGKVHNKTNFWSHIIKMLEAQNLQTANDTRPLFAQAPTNSEGIVSNCSFVGNFAKNGGAIYALGIGLILSFNDFENNSNSAVFLEDSSANFTLCTFHQNRVYDFGGAITSDGASLTVISCIFTENEATGSDGDGGAISFSLGMTLTVFNSTFDVNSASWGGAIYAFRAVNIFLHESTFFGNSGFSGGAVHCGSCNVVLDKCHFKNNSAHQGGALYVKLTSNITIQWTHFADNTAAIGGAVCSLEKSSLFCNFSTFQ